MVSRSVSKPNSVLEPIKLPYVIENGPREQTLRFPLFQQELLSQRHWSPADNLGRFKLIISEGVSYTSSDNKHVEKLKNLVVFSFQHAPQGKCRPLCWISILIRYRDSRTPEDCMAEPSHVAMPAGIYYYTASQ